MYIDLLLLLLERKLNIEGIVVLIFIDINLFTCKFNLLITNREKSEK